MMRDSQNSSNNFVVEVEKKLSEILAKLDHQDQQLQSLNSIVWSDVSGNNMMKMTERQEQRIESIEKSLERRLAFNQAILITILTGLVTLGFSHFSLKDKVVDKSVLIAYRLPTGITK